MQSKRERSMEAYWRRHPRQGFAFALAIIAGLVAIDLPRIHSAHGQLESTTWGWTILGSVVAASLVLPVLVLASRPATDPKERRRGSLLPLSAVAVPVLMVPLVASHRKYGPQPGLADAWTLAAAVFSDVLLIWMFIAGLWLVRRHASAKLSRD